VLNCAARRTQKAVGPPPTNVGHPGWQPSFTVNSTVLACPVVRRRMKNVRLGAGGLSVYAPSTLAGPSMSIAALVSRLNCRDCSRLGPPPPAELAVTVTRSRPSPPGTVDTPIGGRGVQAGGRVAVSVGVRVHVGVSVADGAAVRIAVEVRVAVRVGVAVAGA
jgi:hypothetical protein